MDGELDSQDVTQPLVVWIFGALWALLAALIAALWKTKPDRAEVYRIRDVAVKEVTETYERRDADLLIRIIRIVDGHYGEQQRMHHENREDLAVLNRKLDTVLATVRPTGH